MQASRRWIVYKNETYYPDAGYVEADTAREAVERFAGPYCVDDLETDYFAVPADAVTWFGPLGSRALTEGQRWADVV